MKSVKCFLLAAVACAGLTFNSANAAQPDNAGSGKPADAGAPTAAELTATVTQSGNIATIVLCAKGWNGSAFVIPLQYAEIHASLGGSQLTGVGTQGVFRAADANGCITLTVDTATLVGCNDLHANSRQCTVLGTTYAETQLSNTVSLCGPAAASGNTAPTIVARDVTFSADEDCGWDLNTAQFDITVNDAETPGSLVTTFTYNGGALPASFSRSQSPATIVATVSDGELSASASFTITIVDRTAPTAVCIPSTNPSAKNTPTAGTTAGNSGMNPDGFYQLVGSDNCDGTAFGMFIADNASAAKFGPYAVGTKFKLIQAKGATPNVKSMNGYIQVTLKGDALISGVDAAGNSSEPQACLVPSNK